MAAARELSQMLDVKIDTKEQRNRLTADYPNAKNWTKFHVKIEAIQCFPCYVKVTLSRNHAGVDSSNQPLIVRITIPGLHVQLAASRTKPHCYGLFWKNNRKRCSIFLAFPTEQDRCMHMAWMKESIKELERYRQDFLEIRRASRCSVELTEDQQPVRFTDVFSNYQNLGPLPPIPVVAAPITTTSTSTTESLEWSRRQSTVSGIYEEIGDPNGVKRREKETIGNGIYEPLFRKRSDSTTQSLLAQTPPPLPPRQRINTMEREEIASETLKKNKKYKSVLESIFGKQQQHHGGNSRKISESSNEDNPADDLEAIRDKFNMDLLTQLQGNLTKNKRHSMSTPELANWEDGGRDSGRSTTENIDLSDWQDVSCMSLLSESLDISAELNISDKIRPNYNLSMNASNVNLVGCNFNAMRESEVGTRQLGSERRSLNQLSGYCVMRPIPSQSPSDEGVDVLPPDEGADVKDHSALEKSSGYCPMGPMGFDREHVRDLDQQPVRGIVFNEDRVKVWTMGNITMTRGIGEAEGDGGGDFAEAEKRFEEEELSFLRRKPKTITTDTDRDTSLSSKDEDLYENCKSNRTSRGSKYLVDDKIPSYFPNDSPPHPSSAATATVNQVTPPKLVPKQRSRASMTPSPRLQHYSPRAVPNIYSVPRNNSPVLMDSAKDTEMLKQSLTDSMCKLSLMSNSPLSQPASPGSRSLKKSDEDKEGLKGSPDKYNQIDTHQQQQQQIQSPVSHKYLDKCLKTEFVSLKKFASLPRFRKLDLSPLRIKLNSVLHRHNSEF